VEGENLGDLVARAGALGEAQVLVWAGQLLDALVYLHAQSPPVIHRDVKPQNVIIRPGSGAPSRVGGAAVLVDFGVVKYMVPGQPTATVARAGSPGYAPIEQYAGGTDQRSDIYSLGATLYFVLTGSVPPESPLLMSGQTLPHPRQLNPAISRHTEVVVLRAMQPEASSRFQSAQEMQAALQGKTTSAPAGGKVLNGFRKMSRKQQTFLFLLAALVMVVLCALGWVLYDSGNNTPPPTIAPPTATIVETAPPTTATVEVVSTEVVSTATSVPGDVSTPVQPTETTVAPSGKPTSTLMPTSTPTPTRRPPPPTYTPTATATPQPPTEPPPEPTEEPTNPPPPPEPPPEPTKTPPPP